VSLLNQPLIEMGLEKASIFQKATHRIYEKMFTLVYSFTTKHLS
jgi:hypothetical protein